VDTVTQPFIDVPLSQFVLFCHIFFGYLLFIGTPLGLKGVRNRYLMGLFFPHLREVAEEAGWAGLFSQVLGCVACIA